MRISFLFFIMAVGCNKASFSNDNSPNPETVKPVVVNTIGKKDFALTTIRRGIDMVWIVDNSGSMLPKIAKVIENIEKFLSALEEKSDIHLVILSSDGASPREIDLTISDANIPDGVNFRRINASVGSWDSLILKAGGICGKDDIIDRENICGHPLQLGGPFFGGIPPRFSIQQANTIKNKLIEGFDKDRKKVFVFVTDDDAEWLKDDGSIEILMDKGLSESKIFGFLGPPGDQPNPQAGNPNTFDCLPARFSQNYIQLVERSGGKYFDICREDWTQHFDELTQGIEKIAHITVFEIEQTLKKIVDVEIDGQKIEASQYEIDGNNIEITEPELLLGKTKLVIT